MHSDRTTIQPTTVEPWIELMAVLIGDNVIGLALLTLPSHLTDSPLNYSTGSIQPGATLHWFVADAAVGTT